MFTSRPSDPRTVLLWGDRWHFPGREASEPFRSLAEAADLLVAHFADEQKPVLLRLVFQPDSLESVAVACPQGDRRVIAFALSGEFPALTEPGCAWGHEPVMAQGEAYSTVLHFEAEPALVALATHLAKHGLAVDSAWPLVTFLHAMPEDWTESGALTVVAVRPESAVAYRHPKDSGRAVVGWRGENTVSDVGQWLAGLFAEDPSEPVLLVCADNESAEALATYIGNDDRPGLEALRVAEALGRRVVLPRYYPAQLLPREPVVTAQRLAIAASIALFFAAGAAGFAFGRDWFAVQAEMEQRQTRLATLRTDVAHLRTNAAEITEIRSLVEKGTAGPPVGQLLRRLSTLTPPEMVLSGFRMQGRNFELAGWATPAAPPAILEQWRQAIAPPDAAWKLDLRPSAGGAFSASGTFRP